MVIVSPLEKANTIPDVKNKWQIYIIQCGDGTLYTGVTKDIFLRICRHNAGKGAKYTRGRRPVNLVYLEAAKNHGSALKREHEIKKLRKGMKISLIEAWTLKIKE